MHYSRKNTSESLFSWRGRFSRLSYLSCSTVAIILFAMAMSAGLFYFAPSPTSMVVEKSLSVKFAVVALAVIALILLIYTSFVFSIRRLHDLNLSGWLSLVLYVPIIGNLFYWYIALARGAEGRNEYGQPRDTRLWEGLFGLFIIILTAGMLIFSVGYAVFNPSSENIKILSVMFKNLVGI